MIQWYLLKSQTHLSFLFPLNFECVLVSSASSGDAHLKLLSDVAQAVKGQGTIAWVNCG